MLEANIKEYEILKSEVKDIKSCITRYVSYIIGTNGIVLLSYKLLIYKYLTSERPSTTEEIITELNSFSSFYNYMPIFAVVIIFSLYFVLSYKFGSHNRYIGFIQLLSQEVKYLKIDDSKNHSIQATKNLDEGYTSDEIIEEDIPSTIISWESTISRFNSKLTPKSFPKRHYDNLDFRFLINKDLKYSNLKEYVDGKDSYNVIQGFLKNTIWDYYYKNIRTKNYYYKYDVKSWRYPAYIFFLVFIQISILIPVFLIIPFSPLFKVILFSLMGICMLYFLYDMYQIMYNKKSVNYYCWSFFTYRVQLLNTFKIRPVFYSTSFARYFKAAQIINYLKDKKREKEWRPEASKLSINDQEINSMTKSLFYGFKIKKSRRKLLKFCREKVKN